VPPRLRLRLVALALALYVGWHGYRVTYDDRSQLGHALLWDLLALCLLSFFAWDGSLPRPRRWPLAVRAYVRRHPVELGVLAAIVCIGLFVRLFRYGDLPPTGYLYLEEHINAGIAWDVLHGDRPYAYPLVRYSTALGLWLFGPSTFGLRAPVVAAGMLTIVPFYLMMREVVDRPAALFATALFASLKVFADTSVQFQVPTLAVIVMIWTMLRGLRTGNALWLVPAATLAAVMSYEYETFKAVPIFASPYIAFIVLRALVWPLPRSFRPWLERVRGLAPRAIVAAVVIIVAFLIATGPLMAERHRGQHIYFASLDRQEGDRKDRGTPGLFSPQAKEQTKWALQVFTPWVKPDYVVLGPVETRGVIDKITSLLIWAGFAAAALMFWRGARALFLGWFVGGLIVSGLLLSVFAPWKVAGFAAPAIALTGFLADDALLVIRRGGRRLVAVFSSALVVVVLFVLFLNLRAMNANANDQRLLREWSNTQSQLYAICDYLRGRPDNNFAFVSQGTRSGWGFSAAPKNDAARAGIWADFRFVCYGLEGQQVSDLQDAWPAFVEDSGPKSLLAMNSPDLVANAVRAVQRAMPELGQPAAWKTAPGKVFQVASFDTTGDVLNARRGLNLSAGPAGEPGRPASIVRGAAFALPAVPVGGALTLSGLVFLPDPLVGGLRPVAPPAAGLRITLDGALTYDASAPAPETPRVFAPGWHLLEVMLTAATTAGSVSFEWHGAGGDIATSDADFFAPADPGLWTHVRTLGGAATGDIIRYDYSPHFTNFDGLRLDALHALPSGTTVTEDRWSARWSVEQPASYRLVLTALGEAATLRIDGRDVLAKDRAVESASGDVSLDAGDHRIELTFRRSDTPYIGGVLHVTDDAGREQPWTIRPF